MPKEGFQGSQSQILATGFQDQIHSLQKSASATSPPKFQLKSVE